ncbi:hypothetical protein AC1031_005951 [Aphanomyces cochlioides]|nr:hypothetical protein AC1031_005951 [Aphanomyces cochlioides]
MDRDDILDDMSLSSDDEMLEDMINEMKEEVKKPTPAPHPRVVRPVNTVARSNPQPPVNMPDLGQMMSQMMPMMSQMFGGGNMNRGASNRITRSMEDMVADHVPKDEVAQWVETIQRDEARQKNDRNTYSRNLSRSYRTKVDAMPTANLEASTLLQELLITAVRNAKCKPSPSWDEAHLGIHRQLKDQGVGDIYARELRVLLKHRAVNNPDYAANPGRFPNITSHLATA